MSAIVGGKEEEQSKAPLSDNKKEREREREKEGRQGVQAWREIITRSSV